MAWQPIERIGYIIKNSTNEEVWKDIQGYEGYYQVSSFGRVRSLNRMVERSDGTFQRVKGRVLKQTIRNKYMRVILAKDNKINHQSVHRLVAKAFVENEDDKEYVHHIDGDKFNNNACNLQWVTPYENSHHAKTEGLYCSGENHVQSKIKNKDIPRILNLYYVEGLYQKDIGEMFNLSQTAISSVVRGKTGHFRNKEFKELLNELRG